MSSPKSRDKLRHLDVRLNRCLALIKHHDFENFLLKWGAVSVTSVPDSVFSVAFLYNYAFPLSLESMLN
jgi:hypothetical protein